MTFPTVQATNTGVGTASTNTAHVANMPAGIAAGDLLIMVIGSPVAPGTISCPGWTFFSTESDGANANMAFAYKTATGSEGATQAITTVNSVRLAFITYRISGWSGTPERGTAAPGAGTSANPPSLSPSWGSADTLWIAACDATCDITSAPANYTNLLKNITTAYVGAAQRQLTASSDDPGTFTLTYGGSVAQTYAIKPAPLRRSFGTILG